MATISDIDKRLDRLITQYRESDNLKGLIRGYLEELEEAKKALCDIPTHFDIDTAVGNQLTIIGRWLGFPRCHNVPSSVPVFGFKCDGISSQYNLRGFCEGAMWLGCTGISTLRLCINEDEIYRKFLYVRRYQLLGKNDYNNFQKCIKTLFGTAASYQQNGRVIKVKPNRQLSNVETTFLKVYERVLPRSLSATINIEV